MDLPLLSLLLKLAGIALLAAGVIVYTIHDGRERDKRSAALEERMRHLDE